MGPVTQNVYPWLKTYHILVYWITNGMFWARGTHSEWQDPTSSYKPSLLNSLMWKQVWLKWCYFKLHVPLFKIQNWKKLKFETLKARKDDNENITNNNFCHKKWRLILKTNICFNTQDYCVVFVFNYSFFIYAPKHFYHCKGSLKSVPLHNITY